MNAIVTRPPSLPPVMARPLADKVRRLASLVTEMPEMPGRFEIPASLAPSPADRAAMVAHHEALRDCLVPVEPAAVNRMIGVLRAGFPAAGQDLASARAVLTLYVDALKPYPEWAIAEACRRFRDGVTGCNPTFAPSPPEMAQEVRRLLVAVHAEIAQLERVLQAEVYREPTREERRRVAELLRGAARKLSA